MLNMADITVVIKAPNQQHEDHPVQCNPGWTVQQLKGHISENYPSKPALREQRLIYSGQLLDDTARLGDVLRRHEDDSTIHTVHLVCSPSSAAAAASQQSRPTAAGVADADSSVRQRQHQQVAQSAGAQTTAPSATGTPVPSIQQRTVAESWLQQPSSPQQQHTTSMQHLYAQYWAQYMHMLQTGVMPTGQPMWPPTSSSVAPVPSVSAQGSTAPAAAAPAPALAPAAAHPAPGAAQDRVLNGQDGLVGVEGDDDEGARDWLEWMYGATRMALIAMAIYFYSSGLRLFLVFIVGLAVYLYNNGWFQQRQPAAAAAPHNDAAGGEEEDAPPAAPTPPPQRRPTPPQPENEPPLQMADELRRVMDQLGVEAAGLQQPHPFTLIWTIVTSFFASLLPERMEL